MSRVAEFYGIAVEKVHNEHGVPHFRVRYAEHKAVVAIESLVILQGQLPPRAERLVLEWARLRRRELLDNWDRARTSGQIARSAPLD